MAIYKQSKLKLVARAELKPELQHYKFSVLTAQPCMMPYNSVLKRVTTVDGTYHCQCSQDPPGSLHFHFHLSFE